MALGDRVVELLISLRTANYLRPGGAVVEIGAQRLDNTFLSAADRIQHLGRLFETDRPLTLRKPLAETRKDVDMLLTAPPASDFWQWLGFRYAAIDIDGTPGSITLDLNYDTVPTEQKGKYSLVTNFGTTEHVANQLNAFKIIHDLTAPNGIMVHELPAQGFLNHGLFNYNFKFFWMLSRSTGYKIIHADFTPAEGDYGLPENIAELLAEANIMTGPRALSYRTSDAGMLVVMQKSFDIPFVAPLDVSGVTPVENAALKERYWTIFDPDAFDNIAPSKGPVGGHKAAASNMRRASPAAAQSERAPGAEPPASGAASAPPPRQATIQATIEDRPDAASGKRETAPMQVDVTASPVAGSGIAEAATSPASPETGPHAWRRSDLMRPIQTLKRLIMGWEQAVNNSERVVHSSASVAKGVANQSQLINEKMNELTVGIANQSNLMRQKLDALLRVMYELREIQKAQLTMQREAGDLISQLSEASDPSAMDDGADTEPSLSPATVDPPAKA